MQRVEGAIDEFLIIFAYRFLSKYKYLALVENFQDDRRLNAVV